VVIRRRKKSFKILKGNQKASEEFENIKVVIRRRKKSLKILKGESEGVRRV
jgi:hypothetical protein